MKKLWRISLLLAALLPLAACQQDGPEGPDSQMMDGEWEGTGEGRNGIILVRSSVRDHALSSIKVVTQSESSFAQECINTIIDKAISKQEELTLELDGVSGATLTSTGIIDAINMSILASKGITPQEKKKYKDTSTDIVVVGAGGAGLSAAIAAADKGCKVIVLEKQGIIGGNTNYSTGGINAAETSSQRELGIQDSKEQFFEDTWQGGHQLGDKSLIRSFVEHAAATIDWLKGLGADLSDVGLMGGSSIKRTHRPKGGSAIGPHLMKVLKEASSDKDIEIRTRNKVLGLTSSGGNVTGVQVQNAGGSTYTIKAGAVIIATGGFGGNLEMVESLKPELKGFSTLNHSGATGDAFEWVSAVGGEMVQLDQIQIHPTAEARNHILITEAVRGNGAILVNKSGQRFVDEMDTRDVVSAAILKQGGGTAFLVFDQKVRESLASIENYASQGLLASGATVQELAQDAGISPEGLAAGMERYARMQGAGLDEDFGRSAAGMPQPLTTAPFYAVEVTPAIHHTMGGVKVDPDLHVLRADGTVIKGLFAAGEVTGGLHGGNRLGGNGVADIVVNGKIAGETAAASLRK